MWVCGYGGRPTPRRALLATGLLGHPRFAEADSGTATIILDEFNASGFQRLAQCGFVSKRYWNLPINDLRPTDSCHADF